MSKNVQTVIAYTFGAIALVVVLTNARGFAQVVQSLAGGYRQAVGAFISPTRR